MKTQKYVLLQRINDQIGQYFAKKKLIKQLESLSDHELEDAGIVRGSISTYVQSVYSNKTPVDIDEPKSDLTISAIRLAGNDCCHC